jgi:hypothetical protein
MIGRGLSRILSFELLCSLQQHNVHIRLLDQPVLGCGRHVRQVSQNYSICGDFSVVIMAARASGVSKRVSGVCVCVCVCVFVCVCVCVCVHV